MSLAELLCLARATAKNLNSVGWGDFKDADSPICVESKQVRAIIWCSVENLHWFSITQPQRAYDGAIILTAFILGMCSKQMNGDLIF